VAIAQQAVGIDAIQYYLIDVLEESGIENEKTRISILILLGLLKLIFIVVGGKLFDRRGRRPLLFASLAGITVALLLCSFTFMANGGDVSRVPVGFTIFGLALYMSFFSIGVGPGCWLIPSEIFATSIRAKAMSLAAFFNRITATLMSSTFLSTSNAITTGGFFIMLAVICVISIIFIYFYLPETKGRSLEDMSVYFAEVTNDQTLLDAEAKIVQEREAAGGSVEMGSSNKTGTMT
jgi:MFS family permease